MMKYLIRGDKYENTEAIKEYIEAKLARLDKYIKEEEIDKLWDDKLSDIRRREIGFVFQDFYLINLAH